MAVTGNEPVSTADLKMLFPLPIELGGTGATNASDAIVNLGIDTFVNDVVQNWMEIQQAVWKGSGSGRASNPGPGDSVTITLTETSSSTYIYLAGNQEINLANPGTYKITGGFSHNSEYRADLVNIGSGTSYVTLAEEVTQADGTVSFTKTVTASKANARIKLVAAPYSYMVSPRFTVSNITVQRIS